MLIRIARASAPRPSEITPEHLYWSRREWLARAGLAGAAAMLLPSQLVRAAAASPWERQLEQKLVAATRDPDPINEALAPYDDFTHYNNFYEFGTGKGDPATNSQHFRVDPWSIRVDGAVSKPVTLQLEDVLKPHALQERIYRLRCVEAWSMVVPWLGFPLAELIARCEPTSAARYVRFETLHDPERFPAQRVGRSTIPWPYVEGLRMDEAMHPLTLMAVGAYGKPLLPQNGAPLRLVVPWKYGFKSIKSIVRITFLEQEPATTWQRLAAHEYGFYANVNPEVDHPRWSQKRERRLPNTLWNPNWIPTRRFNGYEEEVAHLYAGMDLRRLY